MMRRMAISCGCLGLLGATLLWHFKTPHVEGSSRAEEVVFWHFWGGAERAVVDDVVRRFNASQSRYRVRSVAMPGSNLDVKLFLAVGGGDPPDVVNQDDPILADWAMRGAIQPLRNVADARELRQLQQWLLPAACRLSAVELPDGRSELLGLCNGLDVRALFYDARVLHAAGLSPPRTIAELDAAADELVVRDAERPGIIQRLGFLPNARNLWSWGIVFGGDFYDEARGEPTLDDPRIVAALEWMASYGRRLGREAAAFRARDQSLPGKPFPLLARRYAMIVDGQWRCRDLARTDEPQAPQGPPVTNYGVCPLPAPPSGRPNAGWINGNFFVIPRGARQAAGAWEFMKFWIGFDGREHEAAVTCVRGGWLPVAQAVVDQPAFQEFLRKSPLFAEFVRMARSANQTPRPNVPAGAKFDRLVRQVAEEAMFRPDAPAPAQLLATANQELRSELHARREQWQRFLESLSQAARQPAR